MKTYRLLGMILSLIFIFNLFSCSNLGLGSKNIDESENSENAGNEQSQKVTYYYSVTQKTLHLPECYHIQFMNKEYIKTYSGDLGPMILDGFTLCGHCLLKDEPKTEEEDAVDENQIAKEDATYLINKTKLTIHELDCYHIDRMAEKNIKYTDLSYEELIETEHIPCGTCMPDEYEAYKAAHPEKFPVEEDE